MSKLTSDRQYNLAYILLGLAALCITVGYILGEEDLAKEAWLRMNGPGTLCKAGTFPGQRGTDGKCWYGGTRGGNGG